MLCVHINPSFFKNFISDIFVKLFTTVSLCWILPKLRATLNNRAHYLKDSETIFKEGKSF